jgi:ankyrin repeat protein
MPAVLFSGTGWDWGSLWFHPPEPDPAVHSDGLTALHCAAIHGNLRIVRLLIESNAAVGAQDFGG